MIDKKLVNAYVVKIDGKYYRDDIGNHIDLTEDILVADTFSKKQGAEDTKDYIVRKEWVFGKHDVSVVPITIQEGYVDEAVETLDIQIQLREKDEEIKKVKNKNKYLTKKIKDQENYNISLSTKWFNTQEKLKTNTHQICEKIRNAIQRKRKGQQYNFSEYCKGKDFAYLEIEDFLDQIERGEDK